MKKSSPSTSSTVSSSIQVSNSSSLKHGMQRTSGETNSKKDNEESYGSDSNKPDYYIDKDELEKVLDSNIYPQKRLFRYLHTRKIPDIPENNEKRKTYPLYHSNPISRIFFLWVMPLIKIGYKRTLQPMDLFKLDERLSIEKLYSDFESIWLANSSKYNSYKGESNKIPRYLLVKCVLLSFKYMLGFSVLFCILGNCSSAFNPMLTKRLINFVEAKQLLPHLHVNKGVGYAIGASIIMLLNGIFFNHFLHNSMMAGGQIRSVLTKALLKKSFKLSGYSQYKYSTGKITSMMSTDLSRLELAFAFQPMLWAFPAPIIIVLVLLIINVGPISLVGIALFFVAVTVTLLAFKRMIKFRIQANIFTDQRVTFMREILSNMKMIKYYAWEDAYQSNVEGKRKLEVGRVVRMQYTRNFFTAMALIVPSLCSLIVFLALYKLKGHSKGAGDIFSSLSLFQVLSIQMFFLPISLATGIDGFIALGRIQDFLLTEEEDEDDNHNNAGYFGPCDSESNALELEHCSFEWDDYESMESGTVAKADTKLSITKDEKLQDLQTTSFKGFEDLNFTIKKGEMVIVTGSIGTGKTSLLLALAKFMKQSNPMGKFKQAGSLLLCGYPWVQNTTVRNNILFGSKFDPQKYSKIMDACSLLSDLEILPAADLTEIGERGITLSGGQKARINLARSVYKDKDIYLFDDVLSAVDARVGKHIMDACMLKYLKGKTRILATHQLSLIEKADRVIFLGTDGNFDIGTVAELCKRSTGFANLLEFSQNLAEKEKMKEMEDEAVDCGEDVAENPDGISEDEVTELHYDHDQLELKKRITRSTVATGANSDKNEILIKEEDKPDAEKRGQITNKEERAVNSIGFNIYKEYVQAGAGKRLYLLFIFIYGLLVIFTAFTNLFTSVWLSFWTEMKFTNRGEGFYMGMYCFWVFVTLLFMVCQFTLLCTVGVNASKNLNLKAVRKLLHTPMSFMDTTPIGRVLNRFTKDTDTLDNEIVEQLRLFIYQTANLGGVIIMCIIYLPWFAIAVPFLLGAYVLLADHYQSSGREVKRLEAVQRSFVYNNFNEVLSGMLTIKCYNLKDMFLEKNDFFINKQNEATFLSVAVQRWVALSMDIVAVAFALIITLLCVTRQFHVGASSTGVMLTYVLQLPGILNTLLRAMTQTENDMNSVERLVSYANTLPQEAAYRSEITMDKNWPVHASIKFDNVNMSYRPGLPLVLKNVSMEIKSGEKIGICGRTGAGKSTIMSALYRLVELSSGHIFIDGVDISKIGLYDLRSKLCIIPQDPVLFKGTIRKNLDPFGERSDEELWDALVRGGAISDLGAVTNGDKLHKFHLDQMVQEDGVNFSLGERQLLALSRALVRNSKILILDEATSSVDYETDSKIQSKIIGEFSHCTILCIAHRLKTILNYDRILVLDRGEIKEFDTPYNLYHSGGNNNGNKGIFRDMCDRSGITADNFEEPKRG
ncbi:ATP-binding cassette transporter YOR1 SCDLUD_004425 [Saccharomycodes ludwigii]|uniref:ATP-binding cassette transporter YOR1 n=1 Tax=Saccharomycodes ludwigii TaxID=36035 RepID=UPI001E87FFD4|nr:hypothetical protein SCDLUD_004425 [Saccharomycodes ludwigii]KAH3899004.1 hypothetical protein SCDLUD_004425 [Saccharomycodes ludwigii]